jgi:hypothetical protein
MGEDSGGCRLRHLNSHELHETIDQALAEVSRRLESGELDGSGRYFTDDELAAGAATGGDLKPAKRKKASAA